MFQLIWTNRNVVRVVADVEPQVEYCTTGAKVFKRNEVAMVVDTKEEMGCARFCNDLFHILCLSLELPKKLPYFL